MGKELEKAWGVLCFLLWATVIAFGQVYTGSITGTVKDPTRAVVPNGNVTIPDGGRGFTYTAQTGSGGIFTVRNLPPASYTERMEAPGFTPYERQNIVLQVNSNCDFTHSFAVCQLDGYFRYGKHPLAAGTKDTFSNTQ